MIRTYRSRVYDGDRDRPDKDIGEEQPADIEGNLVRFCVAYTDILRLLRCRHIASRPVARRPNVARPLGPAATVTRTRPPNRDERELDVPAASGRHSRRHRPAHRRARCPSPVDRRPRPQPQPPQNRQHLSPPDRRRHPRDPALHRPPGLEPPGHRTRRPGLDASTVCEGCAGCAPDLNLHLRRLTQRRRRRVHQQRIGRSKSACPNGTAAGRSHHSPR